MRVLAHAGHVVAERHAGESATKNRAEERLCACHLPRSFLYRNVLLQSSARDPCPCSRTARWTFRRLSAVMQRQCGLRSCPSGVWRMLRRSHGVHKSLPGGPAKAMKSLSRLGASTPGPHFQKARRESRTIVFIDQTGLRLQPTVRRLWAQSHGSCDQTSERGSCVLRVSVLRCCSGNLWRKSAKSGRGKPRKQATIPGAVSRRTWLVQRTRRKALTRPYVTRSESVCGALAATV